MKPFLTVGKTRKIYAKNTMFQVHLKLAWNLVDPTHQNFRGLPIIRLKLGQFNLLEFQIENFA